MNEKIAGRDPVFLDCGFLCGIMAPSEIERRFLIFAEGGWRVCDSLNSINRKVQTASDGVASLSKKIDSLMVLNSKIDSLLKLHNNKTDQ